MTLKNKFVAGVLAAMLICGPAISPVAAQGVPMAGYSVDDPLKFWQGYSVGTYVMVGGVLFLVTIGGLVLASGDDSSNKPSPAPNPGPAATTTTS